MPNRTIFRGIPTGIVCAVLAIIISGTPFGQALDDWFSDACFILRGPRTTSAKIVIISVDDASLDELQKPAAYLSPELARAIRYSARQGASAIGLDFFIPASLSNLNAIEDPQAGDDKHGDGREVAAAADETQRLVLPIFIDNQRNEFRKPLEQWQGPAERTDHRTPYGLLNLTTDADLFVRRQRLLLDSAMVSDPIPSFALAVYARSRQASVVPNGRWISVSNRRIPVDAQGRMRINFVGPAGTPGNYVFPVIPLREVLAADRENRALPELDGAIVIIGTVGAGQQDIHPTPYSNGAARLLTKDTALLTPGPEVHAHIIATIHDQAYLTRPFWLAPPPWALLVGIGLGATFARVSLSHGAAVLATFLIVLFAAAYTLFVFPGWLLNPVPIALTALTTYTAVLARRWWQLRRIFAVVKSEAVTRALEADPRRLDPGGELREITALFADIRGFTTFSERCGGDPKQVVALLNAYYTIVIPAIEAAGGTIIAFMGDGLMVLFGAPVTQTDHAARAARAALAMTQAVRDHRSLWEKHQFPDLRIGVGVHSGPAVVGAIGSGARKDYTAIGDTINTASRVEGETKHQAADVLITAATRSHLESEPLLAARCSMIAEPITLKGRKEPVQLFQLT